MSSFTRNSRRANSDQHWRTFGAGLALIVVNGAALANGTHRFVFTAYSDASGGVEVIAGRYRAALEKLTNDAGSRAPNPSALNTNRCIAYSMTLQWQQARTACDAAVRAASTQRNQAPSWWGWAQESDDEYLALAYANRAVLEWMSSDEPAAREDLAKAREIAPQSDFVEQNVDALDTHGEVARAGTPAPRS